MSERGLKKKKEMIKINVIPNWNRKEWKMEGKSEKKW